MKTPSSKILFGPLVHYQLPLLRLEVIAFSIGALHRQKNMHDNV
jgi:hypothetical protein